MCTFGQFSYFEKNYINIELFPEYNFFLKKTCHAALTTKTVDITGHFIMGVTNRLPALPMKERTI